MKSRHFSALGVWLLLLTPLQPTTAQAPTLLEHEVKAAFVLNFTRFVEWPGASFEHSRAPVVICVLAGPPFEATLRASVEDQESQGRPVDVRSLRDGREPLAPCHALFVSRRHVPVFSQLFPLLRGAPVLTVGETQGFLQAGGIINFVVQDDRVRFEISPDRANEAGLRVSSKLLRLAVGGPSPPSTQEP